MGPEGGTGGGLLLIFLVVYGSVFLSPVLGLVVGAVAGRFTPRVSAGLGAGIGFLSGALGIGSTFLMFLIPKWLGYGWPSVDLRSIDVQIVLMLGSPAVGLAAPIVILQLIRMKRGRNG